eukprot:jgi/Mesen1/930/ME000118S00111
MASSTSSDREPLSVEPEGHTNQGHAIVEGQPSREETLLQHVKNVAPAGDANAVLKAVDDYAWQGNWFMCIGDQKGILLEDAVKQADPLVAVELGAYCGYSATRIAKNLTRPGSKLFSIEINPRNAAIARQMTAHAGLSDKVTVVEGSIQNSIETLKSHGVKQIDLLLLDHHKVLYLKDLLFLAEVKLLKKGSIVVADNVLYPGAPDYLDYVTKSSALQTVQHKTKVEYTDVDDLVTVTTFLE